MSGWARASTWAFTWGTVPHGEVGVGAVAPRRPVGRPGEYEVGAVAAVEAVAAVVAAVARCVRIVPRIVPGPLDWIVLGFFVPGP